MVVGRAGDDAGVRACDELAMLRWCVGHGVGVRSRRIISAKSNVKSQCMELRMNDGLACAWPCVALLAMCSHVVYRFWEGLGQQPLEWQYSGGAWKVHPDDRTVTPRPACSRPHGHAVAWGWCSCVNT